MHYDIDTYINIVEKAGMAWALAGGPREVRTVTLFLDGKNFTTFESRRRSATAAFEDAIKQYQTWSARQCRKQSTSPSKPKKKATPRTAASSIFAGPKDMPCT